MPNVSQVSEPNGNILQWAVQNPQAVGLLIQAVKKNSAMVAKLGPAARTGAEIGLIEDSSRYLLVIPLQFANRISAPSAYAGGTANGTYSQSEITTLKNQVASLTTAVISLVNQLSTTGQNP